ncbi:hypothetical protein DPMN_130999 [Dreissena polymorpha]|uniref:Uncharacterized protein n=1 Tax=Dreissena polymorpha TaxID=45954 RepID=A0A9D4JYW6_DREPO|nr:hypothetical protein DPMN_130999 [Dreissena polymorpha]
MPPLGQSLEEEDLKKLQNDLNQFVQVQPEPAPQFGEAEYQDALHGLGMDDQGSGLDSDYGSSDSDSDY